MTRWAILITTTTLALSCAPQDEQTGSVLSAEESSNAEATTQLAVTHLNDGQIRFSLGQGQQQQTFTKPAGCDQTLFNAAKATQCVALQVQEQNLPAFSRLKNNDRGNEIFSHQVFFIGRSGSLNISISLAPTGCAHTRLFSWYNAVSEIVPGTPHNINLPNGGNRHFFALRSWQQQADCEIYVNGTGTGRIIKAKKNNMIHKITNLRISNNQMILSMPTISFTEKSTPPRDESYLFVKAGDGSWTQEFHVLNRQPSWSGSDYTVTSVTADPQANKNEALLYVNGYWSYRRGQ